MSRRTDPAFSRRTLLGGSATAAAACALARGTSAAGGGASRPVLVQVFLRGAMDGLTTVVPYGDGDLYGLRPSLAVRPPGQANGAVDLDGFFGLAPTGAPLLTPYGNGHLAIVHAAGSHDPTRSHFEAEERMEFADFGQPAGSITSGWAARYLQVTAAGASAPLRGIAVGTRVPLTLREAPLTLPVDDFYVDFPGHPFSSLMRQRVIEDTYARRPASIAAPAQATLDSFAVLGVDTTNYVPENGAAYPGSQFGRRLRDVAALIKGGFGVEVFTLDVGGWDLHANLGPTNGEMAQLVSLLTRAIEAFYLDLLGHLDRYALVVMSEFGRHARENASAGLDHGHGNAMFVLGDVAGGQVIADWPGLAPQDLDHGDLAVTTDYRDVLGELLLERFGLADLATVFPGHAYAPVGLL